MVIKKFKLVLINKKTNEKTIEYFETVQIAANNKAIYHNSGKYKFISKIIEIK